MVLTCASNNHCSPLPPAGEVGALSAPGEGGASEVRSPAVFKPLPSRGGLGGDGVDVREQRPLLTSPAGGRGRHAKRAG